MKVLKSNQKIPMSSIPSLLTLKEACEILKVHPNTLRNWEKQGKISAVRFGSRGDRRFLQESLEKFFRSSGKV